MDVVVNVCARSQGTQWLSSRLQWRGFTLPGVNTDGIGHHVTKPAVMGDGTVIFDVLGPEGMGQRASLPTVPDARLNRRPPRSAGVHRAAVITSWSQVHILPLCNCDVSGHRQRPDLHTAGSADFYEGPVWRPVG